MPLFMDLHKASDYDVKPTVEDIKANHIADLAVQHKYGVKFLQYWINEEAGLVFCLMEAPDKEACAAVHQEAHGGMPCNVIELKGGDYIALMGQQGKVNASDIVEKMDGTLDPGYRVILVADILVITKPGTGTDVVESTVQNAGGRFVRRQGNRIITAFNETQAAVECAVQIVQNMRGLDASHEVRIGISAGEPVTEQKDLFGDAIKLANRLCDIARNGQVVMAPLISQLTQPTVLNRYKDEPFIKMLNAEDERFLHLLMDVADTTLSQPGFSIDDLGKKLGISRAQLYRKVTNLTGNSANAFIRELRLQKALQLMQSRHGNITQVAMEVGFTNPSYFAKNFQDRFGMPPLKALKNNP